ncbi:MAG: hypothetical protein U0835_02130 [Isosphaeraceae bacterium]
MNMSPFVIPIVALIIPMVLVPVVLGIRHARYERELEHAERMRALELGRTLPGDESFWTPPKICVSIGAVVPVLVFMCAVSASQTVGYREEIWVMSGMVSMVAVISGAVLASKHFNQRHEAATSADARASFKMTTEEDAYDVVSARG